MYARPTHALLALACFAMTACNPPAPEPAGTLEGVVTFVGKPVPGSSREPAKGPPFEGPYPDYLITVLEPGGKTVVATTRTDAKGHYSLPLSPGSYVILTRNGPLPEQVKMNEVTVTVGEITRADLEVDTGVR